MWTGKRRPPSPADREVHGLGGHLQQVTDRYLDTVRFRHNELVEPSRWHADLVVNGTLDGNKAVQALCACLERMLEQA